MGWKEIKKSEVIMLLKKDVRLDIINDLINEKTLLVNSDKPKTVVALTNELLNMFNIIKAKGMQPLFLGSKICDIEEEDQDKRVISRNSRLSLECAIKINNYKDIPKVYVNSKTEQLFLYTRDIWSDSITKTEGRVVKGKLTFVNNEDGLFLGLAFPVTSEVTGKGVRMVLKHLTDTGYYLRCEKPVFSKNTKEQKQDLEYINKKRTKLKK